MTSKFSMTSQSMASLKYGKYIEKLNPPVWAIHVELMIVIYAYKLNKVARLEVFLWDTGCIGSRHVKTSASKRNPQPQVSVDIELGNYNDKNNLQHRLLSLGYKDGLSTIIPDG